ncbi:MAG: hypothetical protein UIC65_02720 [Alphaproteobacteria bacterium]|nr:hypothetical protein [Alphaproteobacteria bacterium]
MTKTISDVIKALNDVKKAYGDIKVVISKDSEQNELGDVLFFDVRQIYKDEYYNGDNDATTVVIITPNI